MASLCQEHPAPFEHASNYGKSVFDISNISEWTIEGSPDTVTSEYLSHFKNHGFNRFSCGVQSFDATRLKHLARRHNAEQAIGVVQIARDAGFENISLDLMCGFPGETQEEIKNNIEIISQLGIKQLSFYAFRPTEGTMLRRVIEKQGFKNSDG